MPTIPSDPTNFPSLESQKEGQKGADDKPKATAQDFQSKGPQIPDSRFSRPRLTAMSSSLGDKKLMLYLVRHAPQSLPRGDRGADEGVEQIDACRYA